MPFNLRKVLADGGAIYICTYTYMHAYIIFHDRAKLRRNVTEPTILLCRPAELQGAECSDRCTIVYCTSTGLAS